jgi:ribosomal protein S18 acetylase RimI-like enzyme
VTSQIEIRRATATDAAVVAQLLNDFNAEYDEPTVPVDEFAENLRRLIEAGEIVVLLAGAAREGLAQLQFRASLYTAAPDAYLGELYVIPDRRGEGIGRALLEATMAAAREGGATRIELNTSTDDRAAIGLYESFGFTNREGGPDGPVMLYYERDL